MHSLSEQLVEGQYKLSLFFLERSLRHRNLLHTTPEEVYHHGEAVRGVVMEVLTGVDFS